MAAVRWLAFASVRVARVAAAAGGLAAALASAGCGRIGVEWVSSMHAGRDAGEDGDAGDLEDGAPGFETDDGDLEDDGLGDDGDLEDGSLDDGARDASSASDDAQADDAQADARDADASGDGAIASGDAALDSGAAPADAGGSNQPGTRLLIDNSGSALGDYPVRFSIDTAVLIRQGLLASDCSTLRVFGGPGCAIEHSFFLPQHSCNRAASELWVRLPSLAIGREVLRISFASGASGSNGGAVFPFFEGFEGGALDRSRWSTFGTGSVSVADGLLRSSGVVLLQSGEAELSAGAHALGVRIAAAGEPDTDVELGAGTFFGSTDLNDLWAYSRSWQGVTFVSYDETTYALEPPTASSCRGTTGPGTGLGMAWVDQYPTTPTFLTAEFGYAIISGRSEAWLNTSRGLAFRARSDSGCTLPATLPILIGFDHNASGVTAQQQLDYVYVRPAAQVEPTTSVMLDSTLACGTQ